MTFPIKKPSFVRFLFAYLFPLAFFVLIFHLCREFLWWKERNSFSGFFPGPVFFPWENGTAASQYPLPGPVPQGPAAIGSFAVQFYRGWGAVLVPSLPGLLFTSIVIGLSEKRPCGRKFLSRPALLIPFVCFLSVAWCLLFLLPGVPSCLAPFLLSGLLLTWISFCFPGPRLAGNIFFCCMAILSLFFFGWVCAAIFCLCFWIFSPRPKRMDLVPWIPVFCLLAAYPLFLSQKQDLPIGEILSEDAFSSSAIRPENPKEWKLALLTAKTQRLCIEGRYEEALQTANRYWFSHPCPIEDVVTGENSLYGSLSENELGMRAYLASYTKTALVGSHRLNRDFFSYYRIPEIYNGMADLLPDYYHIAHMLRHRSLDHAVAAYCEGMNLMEIHGPSHAVLELSIPALLACRQWGLAEKYIDLLEKSLFHKKEARRFRETMYRLQHPDEESGKDKSESDEYANGTEKSRRHSRNPDPLQEINRLRKGISSGYTNPQESPLGEAEERWKAGVRTQSLLEYLCLHHLLYKQLDSVLSKIPEYIRLSGQNPPYKIPSSWQEAVHIVQTDAIFPIADSVRDYLEKTDWQPSVRNLFGQFVQARLQWQNREKDPESLTREFGHTFAYNYYFSRFVFFSPPRPESAPLAH